MTDEKSPQEEESPPPIKEAAEPEESAVSSDADSELPEILEKLEDAESRAEAMHERSLRALAELDNFRKRMARDRVDLMRSAAADVIESLLPALDNLKLGLQSASNPENLGEVVKGFEMVGGQILSALEDHGLKPIDPTGEAFDPHFHDSLSTQPSEEVEEGTVLQTLKVGYLLKDKLLRPASVIVSSGPDDEATGGVEGAAAAESES
jgi:molecular chaperone GrpE